MSIRRLNGFAGAAAVAALLCGCTPEMNPVDSVKTQIEARPAAQEIVGGIEAERALQTYVAKHGENPPSLEALEKDVGKLKAPPPGMRYRYDPETGRIELVGS